MMIFHYLPAQTGGWAMLLRVAGLAACRSALCFALCCTFSESMAQTSVLKSVAAANEERVKAAFLHKFLSYAEWPAASFARPDSPYVIGVLNADDTGDELTRLAAGRMVDERPVIVKRLHAGDSMEGLHVLFVGKSERARQASIFKQASRHAILLVTETEGALSQGSMINFRLAEERLRFEVSLDPVEKAGLKLNSRLLSVALSIVKGTQQ